MKMSRRTLLPMIVTLVAVVGLTACGSDDKSSTDTDSSSTTTTKAAAGGAAIKTATNPDLGTILVDAEGKTVYTFTKDGEAVECVDTCLTVWPAVLLPDGSDSVTAPAGVTDLGTESTDAGEQVTSGGLPLYTFSGDSAAGDVNGNNVEGFGGLWQVVVVGSDSGGAGAGAGAGAGTETSTTTATDGYDDGY
jgi:predicted lipoprotein with Yx(FWY)xxD motif